MEIWQISVTQIESEELRMLVQHVQPLKYGYYRYDHPTNASLSRTTHRLFLTRVLNRETEPRE
jgi:ethanolamine utilization cobalamin adenosyltransferase